MVRRLKSDLTALGTSGFPVRRLVQLDLTHANDAWHARAIRDDQPSATEQLGTGAPVELELSRLLARYTELACPAKGRGRLVFINLQKRLLSSIEAFARTLEKHAVNIGAAAAPSDEPFESSEDDDSEGGLSSEARDAQADATIARASQTLRTPDAGAQKLLAQMRTLAQQHRHAADAKARALIAWIRQQQCPAVSLDESPRGASKAWTERRVIIFTEYGHTQSYLRKLLESAIEGTEQASERIRVFDGGMSEENRALLQEEFNGDPVQYPVRILIATDAAREGVNCADLFHYDIPWNPGRLEQRNGRIDRTLQSEPEVRCHYFFHPQRAEDEVLRAVVRKVGQIQRELGSVGAVVFEGIADLLDRGGLNAGVVERIEAEEQRVRATSRAAGELEEARSRALDKEVGEAERILNDSRSKLEFAPELLPDAIDVGLALAGAEPLANAASPAAEPELSAYSLPQLGANWAQTLDSARPARKRDEPLDEWRKRPPLPVVFQSPEKLSTPVVQRHLKHPIVQRLLARFLAQGYSVIPPTIWRASPHSATRTTPSRA